MVEYDYKMVQDLYDELREHVLEHHPKTDIPLVDKAFEVAELAHREQKRLSGEPFVIHPLAVGLILARNRMDAPSIIAALLHDVVEDTGTVLKEISDNFGDEIAHLVDGVTKISSLKNRTKSHEQAESLRKMLLATIDDPRVIIIKLADKTHNMRTLEFQPRHKQKRIAQEVLDIYAPLAGRLGMSKIRSELEDLAFLVLHPDAYKEIHDKISARKDELENYLTQIRSEIEENLSKMNISARIFGRVKHYYSIYQKMIQQDKPFEEIFDIRAIRIITDEIKDCYAILGIVHTIWQPLPSRFKDYIAVPKSNMYQSLHTTVTGPNKQFLEIQIRTEAMNITAEMGIAAHWIYKEHEKEKESSRLKNLSLLQNITKWRSELKDTREFMQALKMDLYSDEIFVFTPKGKIIKLAKGATPIDFAYAIHTEIGQHCAGAIINNKISPLKTKLKNGDIVSIITNPSKHPSDSWLKFVRSSNARYKIRSWLKKQKALEQEKNTAPVKKEAEPKVAEFVVEKSDITKIPQKTEASDIVVDNNMNVPIRLAQCCQPIPGDDVVGFISKDKKIAVHKRSCSSLQRLNIEKERFINISWSESIHMHPVKIVIDAIDRPNLLAEITTELSHNKINIIRLDASESKGGFATIRATVEVKSVDHLQQTLDKIKALRDVVEVSKLNEKVIRRK